MVSHTAGAVVNTACKSLERIRSLISQFLLEHLGQNNERIWNPPFTVSYNKTFLITAI
jgi:hypothetical protein